MMEQLPNIIEIDFIIEDMDGDYESTVDCPLARALKRIYPENEILVGGWDVTLYANGDKIVYKFNEYVWTPDKCAELKDQFEPFKLTLTKVK